MAIRISLPLVLLAMALGSCQTGDNATGSTDQAGLGFGRLHLGIHDDPIVVDGHTISKVLTTVTEAEFHGDEGWVTLDPTDQEVDILELQDGPVGWLGAVNLPTGDYGKIRLKISEARAIVDGEEVELKIPSGYTSGIKIDTDLHIGTNQTTWVQLDFDLDESIHQTGNGEWVMEPVLKLDGVVSADDVVAIAQVQDGAETVLALPDGASITLEAGALPGGTVVSFERIVDEHGGMNPSPVYEVLPSGPLAANAQVTLPYYDLPKGLVAEDLEMAVDRALVPAVVDEQTSTITATLDHFCHLTSSIKRETLRKYTRVRRENDAVTVWADLESTTPWIAAEVDLSSADIDIAGHLAPIHATAPDDSVFYATKPLKDLVDGSVDFAINTIEQITMDNAISLIGGDVVIPARTIKFNGTLVYAEPSPNARVELRIENHGTYRTAVVRSQAPHGLMLDAYVHVLGSKTTLVWGGEYQKSPREDGEVGEPHPEPDSVAWKEMPEDLRKRLPRTIAGTNVAGDKLLLMVIGGDSKYGEKGMNLKEAFEHVTWFFGDELEYGLLLDGGLSSTAMLDGLPQLVGRGEAYEDPRPVMAALSITAPCSDPKFQDVSQSDWFYHHVTTLMCTGAIDNATWYKPGDPVTRAQFLKLNIEVAFPEEVFVGCADESFDDFVDVPRHAWYARYVEFARTKGMIDGYLIDGDRYFKPDQSISRAEAAEILVKMGADDEATEAYRNIHRTYDELGTVAEADRFGDVPVGHWAFDSIHALRLHDGNDDDGDSDGIICGQGSAYYKPNDPLLREVMARIVCIASGACAPESC